MADNFDIKNFLFENKLGSYSKLKSEDLGDGLADAEAEKQMDFLAEDFKYFDNKDEFEKDLFDKWPEAEKYKKEYEDGRIVYSDGQVNWGEWNPNRPNTPSGLPPGAVNQNVGMTARDLKYPKGSRMDEGEAAYEYEKGKEAGKKEEEQFGGVNEDMLSPEAMDRMDSLVPQTPLKALIGGAQAIIRDLDAEGFDKEDIFDFIVSKIKTLE
jgi:hypothetical protein